MPNIALLPGDGIGPEVAAAAVEVLNAVADDLTFTEHPAGGAAIDLHGVAITNEAMEAVRSMGSDVLAEKTTGLDVTEEYIDLQARIRTKQALEAQFLEIMKQAKTVSDALEVQRQISEVRGEIERLEGRRRFLENQSSLSTIKITLSAPAPVVSTSGTSFGDHVRRAFGDAVDTASAIIIGFIRIVGVMTPVVVLIGRLRGFGRGCRWPAAIRADRHG